MRKIFFALTLLSYINTYAQDTTTISIPTKSAQKPLLFNYTSGTINNLFSEDIREGANNRLTIDFDYAANSNAAPSGFAYAFLFKHDITKAMKDRIDNNLKSSLLFEDFMKTGWTYRRYFKKVDAEVFFSYQHRQMRNLIATKESFELLFYGNARFAGDTADLSNMRVQNFIYNQYCAGIKKKIDYGKYQMEIGVGLSFLQVISQQDIKTNSTWIYTAQDGDTLKVNYDLTFNSAREGKTEFFQRNGLGAAGDFHLGFMNSNKWKLNFDVSDVGYMYFRRDTPNHAPPVNYTGTKYIEFQGIVIPDLLLLNSQTLNGLNLDSTARSYLPAKSNNDYSLFIPFTVSAVFSKPVMHDKLVLSFGFQYRNLPKYYGYGFIKANYFIKPDMVFSVSGGGGGYSWFNLGVEFAKRWKYFDFTLGTANLLGLVVPSHYPGTGLYLRLGSSF